MRRRRVLGFAAAGLSGLAGCSFNQPSDTATESPSDSPTATDTDSAPRTSTATDSPTATETASPTPTFDPSISYINCNAVTVDAAEYDEVVLATNERFYRADDGYSGEEDFSTGGPVIRYALVRWNGREKSKDNPDYNACTAGATPGSPTPTATPRAKANIDLETTADPYGSDYVVEATTKNHNDYAVDVNLAAFFYADGEHVGTIRKQQRIAANSTWKHTFDYEGDRSDDVDEHDMSLQAERAE